MSAVQKTVPLGADTRCFLFLQGPHGPYFSQLAKMLRAAGATTWRVAFNAGDAAFWHGRGQLIRFDRPQDAWPDAFREITAEKGITDIVLYGDTRPIHAEAIAIARGLRLRIHVFEEGYLRPYWITYERDGSNGNSRLMDLSVQEMRNALDQHEVDTIEAPAIWGDMRQHVFYGALYHFHVMFRNRRYRHFKPHRALPVEREFKLYLKRLLLMPFLALDRIQAQGRIKRGGFPYHLVLLQLEHDSSFQYHSPFSSMTEFVEIVLTGFATGAPRHHHLVFKTHPLEDERKPLRRLVQARAQELGVADRVHFVRGGKLAQLLDQARSAVTVNSTAAQQVLRRGLPLKAFGDAVFAKPEFVSSQPLTEFFATPHRPDNRAYKDFRAYLLETSQVAGGYYSVQGRRQLLRQVPDMMLAPLDPYAALASGQAAPRHRLSLIT